MKSNQPEAQPPFRPIILVGAARSGTKMLRDAIGLHPQVDVVPYDINYIWRLGNEQTVSDMLNADQARPEVIAQIHAEMLRFHKGSPFLLEKTVSNTLRVPFINCVFPDAYYIHLVRDGRDVIESVRRQWTAKPDWQYIIKKARQFPVRKAPRYAWGYGVATVQRTLGLKQRKKNIWGSHYPGMEDDLNTHDLLAVCARQWEVCVASATESLLALPAHQSLLVQYESLVFDPEKSFLEIASFLNLDPTPFVTTEWKHIIDSSNVGKGLSRLNEADLNRISVIMKNSLERYGYGL